MKYNFNNTSRTDFDPAQYFANDNKWPVAFVHSAEGLYINPTKFDEIIKKYEFEEIFVSSSNFESSRHKLSVYKQPDANTVVSFAATTNRDTGKVMDAHYTVFNNITDCNLTNRIVDDLKSIEELPPRDKNTLSLVKQTFEGYGTVDFELDDMDMDISSNYNDDFEEAHKVILERLAEKDQKGLVLLHGQPGTGKSYYIKHLISQIEGKKILFIPPHLSEMITSPQMIPFLLRNTNAILVIEDAERVIESRESDQNSGVSNILNITDGILSDLLNIQVIATFNTSKSKIDSALLRKGRLIKEYEFKPLSVEKSNELFKKLNIDETTDKPLTVAEIYNKSDNPTELNLKARRKQIGFNTINELY